MPEQGLCHIQCPYNVTCKELRQIKSTAADRDMSHLNCDIVTSYVVQISNI